MSGPGADGLDVLPSDGSLAGPVSRALGWSTLAQILGRAGSFAVGIVLARLLTEEDFGAYAVTLVAVNLLIEINDLGVIASVIRWQGDVRDAARTAATVSIVSTLAIFGLAFAMAGRFAAALGSPGSASLVRVALLVVVIDGFAASHQAVLVRTFRNDRLARSELAGFVLSTPLTIGLAVAGVGPWSIIIGRVVGSGVVAVGMVRAVPFPIRPAFDRTLARKLVGFGFPLAVSALVLQGVLQVDYVIVGGELGAVALGLYLLAFNLASWPATLVTTAISRVAFAGFSRLVEDRERLVRVLPRAVGVVLSALVPMVVLLGVLAPEVIVFLYGERWLPAATPLRFLVLLGGLRILIDFLQDLTIADGRPGVSLRTRVVWLAAVIPAIAVGVRMDGLRGVGIAHVLVAAGIVLPWLLVDARRSGISTRSLAREAARPLAAGSVAVGVMVALLGVVHGELSRLAVVGAAGGLTYVGALVPRNPLVGWALSHVRPASAPAAPAAAEPTAA